jgi:hypothetical protein
VVDRAPATVASSARETVNQIRKQHAVAVDLLEKLGLDHVELERQRGGHYIYRAWNTPSAVAHNGSAQIVKRGKVKMRS